MRRRGSKIARYIERDYRIKQAFERKNRAKCLEKNCPDCKYERICEDKDDT